MKFKTTSLKDLYTIKLEPFTDNRGSFTRLFCKNDLKDIGYNEEIVNLNNSFTLKKGSIRGLHFQYPPKTETKIVKCIKGEIFDVAVDIRRDSPTFLKWHGEFLSDDNLMMMYIPKGFAHGYQTIEDNTEVIYLVTESYSPENEGGLRFNDPLINISWPVEPTDMSDKDKHQKLIDKNFKGIKV